MIDELQELRQANPHQREDLAAHVAMSTDDFIDAMRADTQRFPLLAAAWPMFRQWAGTWSPGRLAWSAALACVVAAMVLAARPMPAADTDPAERTITSTADEPDLGIADAEIADDVVGTPRPTPTTEANAVDAGEVDRPSTVSDISTPLDEAAPTTTVPTTAEPTTAEPAPSTAAPSTAVPTTASPAIPPAEPIGLFDPATDLLVVHLDFAHTDDALAALATQAVADEYGVATLAVAGTADPSGAYAHPHAAVMNAAWGSAWLDASADRSAAVVQATQRWVAALDAGGDIWMAEGGVSDFTAEVVATVRSARPDIDTSSRVHVVQHSQRNHAETLAAARSEVVATTDYVWIDDGNSGNGTADLAETSSEFVSAALGGPSAAAWSVGFDQHAADDLDFSDTVAVLHIFGIGVDRVADPTDFAALFLP